MLEYCVYILFSKKDFLLYVGYTSDLKVRKTKHDIGGVKSTAPRRPLELIFVNIFFLKVMLKGGKIILKPQWQKSN